MQQADTKPGPYYVSVRRDDGQYRLLSGPFPKHEEALAKVDAAMRIAMDLDPRACWYLFGTCRIEDPAFAEPGILNDLMAV